MGSKRIGLARTQALLEGLKRELTNGSAKSRVFASNQPQYSTYVFKYDADSDAKTTGEHTLKDPDGNALSLPAGFVITAGWVEVVEAVTSGGSATIEWGTQGTSNDPNGFIESTGKASLTANSIHPFAGGLVHNGSNSAAAVAKRIITTDDPVSITIGTAALTGGKFYVYVQGYRSLG